jgi:hypothetical protein
MPKSRRKLYVSEISGGSFARIEDVQMRLFNHVTGTKSETETQISQSLFSRQSIIGPFAITLMAAPRNPIVSAMYV